MSKLRHKPEQIIRKLREAEVLSGHGKRIDEVCRALGISDTTYYKWRSKYGGIDASMISQMKAMVD